MVLSKKRNFNEIEDECEDSEFYQSPSIQILVGTGDAIQTFYVHKDLLTAHSLFFKNALKEDTMWLESDETISLPDDDPKIFNRYVNLLYSGKVTLYGKVESETTNSHQHDFETDITQSKKNCNMLARLYILCEKLQDIAAKNLILSAYIRVVYFYLFFPDDTDLINTIYDGTPEQSPLRKFMADYVAIWGVWGLFQRKREDFPFDFLFDVAKAFSIERADCYGSAKVIDAEKYLEKLP